MLTAFVAAGLATPASNGSANLVTPTERTITLSRANGFVTGSHTIDPYDIVNYKLDLSPLLEDGEQFASATIAVSTAAALLGFSIPTAGEYAIAELDNSHLIIWPQIDAAKQDAQSWSGKGTACSFEITMETDSQPPRKWQRTASIQVAQK